jgi:Tol biopolymer transport system component
VGKKGKTRDSGLRLKKPERLTAGLTDHEHPAVAPDGEHFAFYAGEFGAIQIYVADLDGRIARCVSPGGNNTQPAWHPAGDRITFRHQQTPSHKWEVLEVPLFEGKPPKTVLADPKWHYKHPCYSPDGRVLAYFSDEGSPGIFHIWKLNVRSGKRKQLTFGDTQNHAHPVISPDHTRIVYHAYEGTDESRQPPVTNLYELELESGEVRPLTEGADQYKHPFYVNDALIVYHHERNTDGRRWIEALDLKTGKSWQLTSGEDNDKHPYAWVDPEGHRWVYWSSKKLGGEIVGEPHTYDIVRARLVGSVDAQKGKRKPKGKWCKTCPMHEVEKGNMTSWKQAKQLGVKGRSRACKDCPARSVLG